MKGGIQRKMLETLKQTGIRLSQPSKPSNYVKYEQSSVLHHGKMSVMIRKPNSDDAVYISKYTSYQTLEEPAHL